jgi:LacI family transcriptional regulator
MSVASRFRVTIHDIARDADVSITAVSRALNGKGELSHEKRSRILDAVHRLGYAPNSVARALVSGSTKTLGVLLTDNTSPVFAEILRGIEDAATNAGFSLLFANSADSQDKALRCLSTLRGKQVDGVLLTPVQTDRRDLEFLCHWGVPFVLLLRPFPNFEADQVVLDNIKAGRLVTRHLLDLGHRRVGHIGGPEHISSARDRCEGYRRALRRAGIPYQEDLVVTAPYTLDGGYAAAGTLLDRPDRPSAIFAATDLQAVGVLKAARERRLRVPEDFALAGGDDIELAEFLEVPLTTFRQPARAIGARGVEILVQRLQDESLPRQHVVFQPRLITRRSSGCPRRHR